MNEKRYPFRLIPGESVYEFESISPNKKIHKAVLFTQSDDTSIFNLALVDVLDDDQISDRVESNNGDLQKVLATVFAIVEDFLQNNPECTVVFRGNDERKHRLYRIAISRELSNISKRFDVYGGASDRLLPFQANVDYKYYFIRRH